MNIVIIVVVISLTLVSVVANLSPLINTIVNKDSEEKRLWFENYFAAKEKAYIAFANAVADCREEPTSEAVDLLYSACICAGFLSNAETGKTLSALAAAIIEKDRDTKVIGKLQTEAIELMRNELKEPSKQKHSKHSTKRCQKPP